jgi:hypothetical protein
MWHAARGGSVCWVAAETQALAPRHISMEADGRERKGAEGWEPMA